VNESHARGWEQTQPIQGWALDNAATLGSASVATRALWRNPFGIRTVADGFRPQRGNAAKPEVVVSSSAFSATSRESRPQNVLR
jgi:hypothetical protein